MQVTKLCDLGIDDSVCSVGWAQRGTHLAVGTSNGTVQVITHLKHFYPFTDPELNTPSANKTEKQHKKGAVG